MSLYGYENAISQGTSFNAKTANFNEAIQAHNQKLTDKFNEKLKQQPGTIASDKTKEEEDSGFYGITDGKNVIGSTVGLITTASEIAKAGREERAAGSRFSTGIMKYAGDAYTQRMNTIGKTASRLGEMSAKNAQKALKPTEVAADGTVSVAARAAARAEGEAGKVAAQAASEEIESSGLGTSILKAGLKKVAGGAISEAGLSVASEIGGKVAGDFGGIVDIGEGIDNLKNGKSFFAGDDKTAEIGDTLTSVGAVADVVGTVFPPAELIGGALGAVGGIFDAYDGIKNDLEQKKNDTKEIKPPALQATKVTPAFSAMGLVASAPISAKAQIVGG